MQTQEAILARMKEREPEDPLGFERSEYFNALTFKNAKDNLKDEVTEEVWDSVRFKTDKEVKQAMEDYMPFAFSKAEGERGISANRSIQHCIAWTWLFDPTFSDKIEDEFKHNYHSYGKHILIGICHRYGWSVPEMRKDDWWKDDE